MKSESITILMKKRAYGFFGDSVFSANARHYGATLCGCEYVGHYLHLELVTCLPMVFFAVYWRKSVEGRCNAIM